VLALQLLTWLFNCADILCTKFSIDIGS